MAKAWMPLEPCISFPKGHNIKNLTSTTFSEASHRNDNCQGQTGVVSGVRMATSVQPDIFHTIDRKSHKQNGVKYSAYRAQILPAAYADNRAYYFLIGRKSLFPKTPTKHEMIVNSRGLYDTITTLHNGNEYRLWLTIQRLRHSFESMELDWIRWIPGTEKFSDALAKRNRIFYVILNDMCSSGIWNANLRSGYNMNSEKWK